MSLNSFYIRTGKWFKVQLSPTNNSIYYQSFICIKLNGCKYCNASLTI